MSSGCHCTPLTGGKAWLYLISIQLLVMRFGVTDSTFPISRQKLRLGRYPVIGITSPAASPLNYNKILVLPLAHNH